MHIVKELLTINQYSRPNIPLKAVKGIVVHWVANATSTALANRNYFEGLKVGKKNNKGDYIYASAHYIVGLEGEVISCIPETEVAYHASSANKDHIGIEVCHPTTNGKFSEVTYKALIELIIDMCKRYGLNPLRDVIRHYDVTGKDCPRYYVQNLSVWEQLKKEADKGMMGSSISKIQIELNGKIKEIDAINIEDTNYVKLRDLADEKIKVCYDAKRKLPIVEVE